MEAKHAGCQGSPWAVTQLKEEEAIDGAIDAFSSVRK